MYSLQIILGHLGGDVETKTSQGGKDYASFSVSVHRYAGKGKEDITDWYNVTAFGQTAAYLGKYAKKGMVVQVIGEPAREEYTTKEGEKRTSFKIIARDVTLVGHVQKREGSTERATAVAAGSSQPDDDTIPF